MGPIFMPFAGVFCSPSYLPHWRVQNSSRPGYHGWNLSVLLNIFNEISTTVLIRMSLNLCFWLSQCWFFKPIHWIILTWYGHTVFHNYVMLKFDWGGWQNNIKFLWFKTYRTDFKYKSVVILQTRQVYLWWYYWDILLPTIFSLI